MNQTTQPDSFDVRCIAPCGLPRAFFTAGFSIKNRFISFVILSVMLLTPILTPAYAQNPDRTAPDPLTSSPVTQATTPTPGSQSEVIAESMLEIFRQGGPLMWALAAGSIIMLTFFIERLIALQRSRVIPHGFVTGFMQQLENGTLKKEEALTRCLENNSPVARVFAYAINKWNRPAREIEQAVLDGGQREVSHLRRNLRVLNAVATVSPLLGLLGTVLGMIYTFQKIASDSTGMGNAEQLAAGISMALLTTAAGLTVAIPALLSYLYFVGRVDRLVGEIDDLSYRVAQLVSEEQRPQQLQHTSSSPLSKIAHRITEPQNAPNEPRVSSEAAGT